MSRLTRYAHTPLMKGLTGRSPGFVGQGYIFMYTEEELIDDLIRANDEVGGNITAREYNRVGRASEVTLQRRFGSFNRAKERAGLARDKN